MWAYVIGTSVIGMSVFVQADVLVWGLNAETFGAIVYSGVLSSFFNYWMMAYVNARTSPIIVMAFYPLQAVLTPIFSAIFLGTTVGATDIIGGAIVVIGLGLCISGRQLEGTAPKVRGPGGRGGLWEQSGATSCA